MKRAAKGLHHHKDVVCIICPIERRLFASLLGTQGPGYTNPLVLDGVSNGLLSPNTLYASAVRGKAPSRASPLTTEHITRFPEPGCAAQSQEVIDDDDHSITARSSIAGLLSATLLPCSVPESCEPGIHRRLKREPSQWMPSPRC